MKDEEKRANTQRAHIKEAVEILRSRLAHLFLRLSLARKFYKY